MIALYDIDFYGFNRILNHPLHGLLADLITAKTAPGELYRRYQALQENTIDRTGYEDFIENYIDNYDQLAQEFRQRFGFDAPRKQVVAGIGFLLCALSMPRIFYSNRRGAEYNLNGDCHVTEFIFNLDSRPAYAGNPKSLVLKDIAAIAALRNREAALKFGRLHVRETSADGRSFNLPESPQCVLAFSRVLFDEEVLIVYNASLSDVREEYVLVDPCINKDKRYMRYIYGRNCPIEIQHSNSNDNNHPCIKLYLEPMQFVILKSQ